MYKEKRQETLPVERFAELYATSALSCGKIIGSYWYSIKDFEFDHEQHCLLQWKTKTLTMNNIAIYHEQHCHLPWTTLILTMNNIFCYHVQHWHLPRTLSFTMYIGICHEQPWHWPWMTLANAVNNIDICHEQSDVYDTWCKNLILKTTNHQIVV